MKTLEMINTEKVMSQLKDYSSVYSELSESFELLTLLLEENSKLVTELSEVNEQLLVLQNNNITKNENKKWILDNLDDLVILLTSINAISIKMRDEVEEKSKMSTMSSFLETLISKKGRL